MTSSQRPVDLYLLFNLLCYVLSMDTLLHVGNLELGTYNDTNELHTCSTSVTKHGDTTRGIRGQSEGRENRCKLGVMILLNLGDIEYKRGVYIRISGALGAQDGKGMSKRAYGKCPRWR